MIMLEREEEVEVTEERTPPPSDSQAGNCFYFDICGSEPDSPHERRQAPVHATPFLVFLNNFRTL
jgi:hypothetical protein